MNSIRLGFVLFGGGATVTRPGDRAEPLGRDRMAGLFTKTKRAVANPLQRAIHLEELVGFVSEFGPEDVAGRVFLGDVGDIDPQHVRGICRLRGMLGMGAEQSIAEMKQGAIMPRPLRRDSFVAAGIRRVALWRFCFR